MFNDDTQLAKKIITNLSFSHISLLLPVDDKLQRAFYALEAIKGTWSVKELRRQINSLLFERCGLSKKPKLLLSKNKNISKQTQATFIKDIYTFEFLGLPHKDAVEEGDLKVNEFEHNNAGQLNTYLNYYKRKMQPKGETTLLEY